MKVGLLLALVAMAIGFTMPTFAQQTNTPDPQLRQQIVALLEKFTEAWNNNDPTPSPRSTREDAVLVTDILPFCGREDRG